MRNLSTSLLNLLAPAPTDRTLSKVVSMVGADLWLVADPVTAAQTTVNASGLALGDYIIHANRQLISNLGPVTITEVNL